ncbi:hypothetical protein AAG906_004573 [Vitis piasezkii]
MLSLRPIRRFCHTAAITAIAPVAETVTSAKSNCIKNLINPWKNLPLSSLRPTNAHNRLVVENRFAFEDTVSRLAGAGRFDYIEHLLEHQKTLPQGRREGFIVRIIMLYGKAGMIKQAVDTFYDMHLFGCQRTVKSFNAALKNNRWEVGNGLWNLMVMKGCLPNLATFNVRIQYLVNRRRAWQANSLMGMMEYLGITPDEVTYNLVIKGFCQAGYLEMAKKVYSALHGKGYKPNVKIYQTMIHYLCKGGEFDMAYTMCKDCMNRNWSLNVDTIYKLLEGLKGNGEIDKAKVLLKLARKRVPSFSKNQLGVFESVLSKKQ